MASEIEALDKEIVEIGERSRNRYREIIFKDIEHPGLVTPLEDVLSYWQDNIRPALIQFSYEAVGGKGRPNDAIAQFFSISGAGIGIHDDIIDETTQKYGRKTIPGAYGRDTAITVADLLIIKGLTWIREALEEYDRDIVYRVLEEFERFFTEMCIGEMMDIENRKNLEINLEDHIDMLWKLGVDAQACCKIGAIMGGAHEHEIQILGNYGRHLGYANRLQDELLDVINWQEKLADRLRYESLPLPVVFSIRNNEPSYRRMKSIMEKESRSENDFAMVFKICHVDGAFDNVQKLSEETIMEGLSVIKNLPVSPARKKLSSLLQKMDIENKKMRKLPTNTVCRFHDF